MSLFGYPEKLANECRNWEVVALVRGGSRLESQAVFSDEYLLSWAKGVEGGNAFHFDMVATPQRRLAWNEARMQSSGQQLSREEAMPAQAPRFRRLAPHSGKR